MAKTKEGLVSRFDCEDCGELDEYVGYKITRICDDALKLTQPVILQSYTNEFELPNCKYPTPTMAGGCLTRCEVKDALGPIENIKYRSSVGKMMRVTQYSLPQTYIAVQDLTRRIQMQCYTA